MNNTTKERNLKLNQLFNSNISIDQVINEILKEDTDFAYFFVFSHDSMDNNITEYFEKNKSEIKNKILNIISTKNLSFDKFYNLILIYTEDNFDNFSIMQKELINTKFNKKNIELLNILLDMDLDKNNLEENLTRFAKLI